MKRASKLLVAYAVIALALVACEESLPFDEPESESAAQPAESEALAEAESESHRFEHASGGSGPTYEVDFFMSDKAEFATLTYEEIDGLAVFEGDIILGDSADLQTAKPRTSESVCVGDICSKQLGLSVRFGESYLWPGGVIPFEVDPGFNAQGRAEIDAGINLLTGATNLQLRPRDGERDYIVFVPDAVGCFSFVGRQIGPQNVRLLNSGCGTDGVAHEILHAAGLWHEHSRGDRDAHITILWENIRGGMAYAFEKHATDGVDVGPYDLQSIMHYGPFAFSDAVDPATGARLPTIETNPPGGLVGGAAGLTADDIAGINQLYPDTSGGNYIAVPGLVFGLRHSQNQQNDFISNPIVQFGDVVAERVIGGDLGAPADVGFEWWMVPTSAPLSSLRMEEIPPGVVVGMWHSQNMSNIPGDFRLASVSGGDLGAPSGVGFVWYENPSAAQVDWDVVDMLPPYTVVGLKHSENQPSKTFDWSDGLTYDPLVSCPSGFDRKSGGDLGAPSGAGFYWCEKR